MGVYDLNTAKSKVTQYGTSKYGRGPESDAEWAAISNGINYADGVDDNELNTAYGNADAYASSIGAKPLQPANTATGAVPATTTPAPAPAAATPAAAGPYDLGAAQAKVTEYGTAKYGRGPQTDAEWAQIGQGINYGDGVSDAELQAAFANADSYAASLGASPLPGYQEPAPGAVPATTTPAATPAVSVATGATANVPANLQPTIGSLFQTTPPSALDTQTQAALSAMLTQAQQPVSINDAQLQPASDAYRSRQQRGAEKMRGAAAERSAATGTLESGGFDTEALGYQQNANMNSAEHDSKLVLDEMGNRRDDLKAGIALANQAGQFEKAQQLQTQLALLNAAMQQQGITAQTALGEADIDVRQDAITQQGVLGRGDLSLRLQQTMLQNQQFYASLGLSAAQIEAKLTQDAMAILMGGM